jgi:hypothetical protein
MKKFEYTNEGKLKLSTGFKTFDKQTNYLGTGNVCANTQFSWYIRPTYETECNGFSFKEGDLFKSDIKNFRLSSYIEKMVILMIGGLLPMLSNLLNELKFWLRNMITLLCSIQCMPMVILH